MFSAHADAVPDLLARYMQCTVGPIVALDESAVVQRLLLHEEDKERSAFSRDRGRSKRKGEVTENDRSNKWKRKR